MGVGEGEEPYEGHPQGGEGAGWGEGGCSEHEYARQIINGKKIANKGFNK